jgi:alkylation response protein AidB-like acyl-CoA dehydrogenase
MDLELDAAQRTLVDTFAQLLEKECPTSHVRACEDGEGFSHPLWERYCELGAHVMGLPESAGGLDMSLLELGLVATESGRVLAPVPFVEVAAVGRALARVAPEDPLLGALAEGRPAASIVLPRPHAVPGTSLAPGGGQLVPYGAVVDAVLAFERGTLGVAQAAAHRVSGRLEDIGSGALARWDLAQLPGPRPLASGDEAARAMATAVDEWKLLTGFSLVGLARRALEIGADYARERVQFGVPIGGFQAIAHPLAECAIRIDGAELLCWEAAWAQTEEPRRFELLASMAFVWASQTAMMTVDRSLHTHGGYGFSTEYDIQLYFRRARALASLAGGAREELRTVADRCFAPDSSELLLGGL